MRNPTVSDRHEHGFSLIELLVVIVITLIVTGSIYGLLATGQNAFRREPEISDRQQQIRVAMDLVQRDIITAGMALPEWAQAFTPGLDAQGPQNAQGVASDFLELIGYDGACTPVSLCTAPANPVNTLDPLPACYSLPRLVATRPGLAGSGASIFVANAATGGPGPGCPSVVGDSVTVVPSWIADISTSGFTPAPVGGVAVGDMKPVQVVRYEIAVDATGIPSLWRSARGGRNAAGVLVAPGAGSDWQLVAAGIEDLQVEYRDGTGNWSPPANPGAPTIALPAVPPTDADWATIVREVRVTLTARTTGQAILQGESFSATGVRAIRGSMTSVTSPRAALFTLSVGPDLGPPVSPQRWQ